MADPKVQLEQFQQLFDLTPAALVAIDPQGLITEWNRTADRLFGLKKDEVINKPFIKTLITPAFQKEVQTELDSMFEKQSTTSAGNHQLVIAMQRPDRSEITVDLAFIPIKTSSGFCIFAKFQDISGVKKQEADLYKASVFLNAIVENIPDMIFIKEAKELRFTRFNKAGEELLGFSKNDLIGKNDYDFFPKEEADFFTSIDRNVLAHKRLIEIPEEPIQTKFKGQRLLHTKKVPIYDENGQPEFLLGISEDITDKKKAIETERNLWKEQQARLEAEKALQLRDDFISIAAHELRTPLTTLSLQIQLLNRFSQFVDPAQAAKYLSLMVSSEDQLNRFEKLVEDLLDVSRASAGMLIVEKTKFDLSEVARMVAKSLELRASKANSSITLSLDSSVIGTWDRVRIEQVVTNLIGNAIKYGAGKPIEISTTTKPNTAVLVIRDHGIGIAAEDQERIFNRFERAVSVKRYGGLGLGLYIANQIVTAHGGRISIDSQVGKGAAFTVELPLG